MTAALAALLLSLGAAAGADEAAGIDINKIRGPKIRELSMLIITNPDAQIMAAEAGELDVLGDITRPSDIDRLSGSKELTLSLARGMHAFFLLLNNEAFPWDDPVVRRAAAMSIDRGSIVRMIFSGYCEPINSWLPPVSPWALANSTQDIYDPEAARKLLSDNGYLPDIAGRLTAPDGRPFPTMKILTPLARMAPTTAELAELIADSLNAVGFPVETEPMDFSTMIARLDRKEYMLAVLAWSMGRNPDSLYSFYHSEMNVEGGYNMTGISDPRLDGALKRLRFAPDRKSAETASEEAQRLLLELMPSVPVYSRISVAAISNKWKNIFTTDKITADNIWTLLTAEPRDGKMRPMTMLLPEEPRNLNPFTASSAYSWQVLGMIYESLLGTNPYTLENMPAIAESWEVRTAGSGESAHTELIFTIKRGLRWSDGSPLTARDAAASIGFIKENKPPRFFDSVKNVRSAEAAGDHTLRVVMNGVSYWYLDNIAGLPCFPEKTLAEIKDWQSWTPLDEKETHGPAGLLGSGPFTLKSYRAGEYVLMERNPHYRLLGEEAK
ncbi:MAG: ABC transporter substrate-binding protein [Synergistaceae bacterium]|nr:ABC transporter substrate-binding protein [Synergistaceae bacterium]